MIAVVPAHNEEAAIGGVIEEIRAFDPTFDVVVVDDGSADATSEIARRHGAAVLTLPFNLGIGGAVQTGFMYARNQGYPTAVRLDGFCARCARSAPYVVIRSSMIPSSTTEMPAARPRPT